jgi:peptidoglycan/LPS O-acetylase OafA/YrhL
MSAGSHAGNASGASNRPVTNGAPAGGEVVATPTNHPVETATDLVLSPPPGNPKFPLLDGLRAIAALAVLGYHWAGIAHPKGIVQDIFGHGDIGVVIFFMLSGFLIYRPFVAARRDGKPPAKTTRFYMNRLARIVPAYWLAVTAIQLWTGLPAYRHHWWEFYFFLKIYDPKLTFDGGLAPAWSLCVEVSFYALLPLYAALMARLLTRTRRHAMIEVGCLAVLAIASALAHAVIARSGSTANLSFTLPGTFYLFAIGMAVAVVSVYRADLLDLLAERPVFCVLLSAVIYVAISVTIPAVKLGSVNPLYIPSAVLLLLTAVRPKPIESVVSRFLGARPLVFVGGVSYAFYLWHQTVAQQLVRFFPNDYLFLIVSAVVGVAVATASYYVVEFPILRFVRRRMSGKAQLARA